MEKEPIKLKLFYKNNTQEKELNFYPKNFIQLKDYFLTIFDQKSLGEYVFKAYPNKNETLIFNEDMNFNRIRRLKILKNPAIFIIDKEEEDYMDEIDKNNLDFIENNENLGFDLRNIYENYNIKQIQEILEKKKNNLKKLQSRIDLINNGIETLKNFPKIDEKNNLETKNKQFQDYFAALNKQLEELKTSAI